MSRVVEIPGIGNVEFPGTMSDDEIANIARQQIAAQNGGKSGLDSVHMEAQPDAGAVERFTSKSLTEPLMHLSSAAMEGGRALLDPETHMRPGGAALMLLEKLAGGVIGGAKEQYGKALDQYDSAGGLDNRGPTGRGVSTTGRVIAAMTSPIGPPIAESIERGAQGDVAGAAGGILGLEGIAGAELARAIPRAAPTIQSRGGAGAAGRTARAATESAAIDVDQAAKEAAWIAEADRIRAMRQANVPTDIEATNTALGVKPADVGKNLANARNPARTALDVGLDTSGSPAEIAKRVDSTFNELTKAKNELLDTDVVVATNEQMRRINKSLNSAIKEAKIKDPEAAAHLIRLRKIAREFTEPRKVTKIDARTGNQVTTLEEPMFGGDLKPRDVVTIMERIRNEVDNMPRSVIKTKLGAAAGGLSKQYNALLKKALGNDYRVVNDRLRGMVGVKSAVNRKGVAEIAKGAPRETAVPEIPPLPERMDMPGAGGAGTPTANMSAAEMARIVSTLSHMTGNHAIGATATGGAKLLELLERLKK